MWKFIFCICLSLLSTNSLVQAASAPLPLQCLWSAYKNFRISGDQRTVIFPDGVVLPYRSRESSGTPVDPHHLTSLEQMFLRPYPVGFSQDEQGHLTYPIPTPKDELRGSRYQRLFFELYGHSEEDVVPHLIRVRWIDGSWVPFNREFGAAAALQKVSSQLVTLLHRHPEFIKFLRRPIGGTFNWRNVANENNISLHSFGIAIDINLDEADYWEWDTSPEGIIHYRNRIPPEIVQVFERNGFMWGGKWYHYDTMHFEFRPEMLMSPQICHREFQKYSLVEDSLP